MRWLTLLWMLAAWGQQKPFVICVTDEQTGRGVPLVEFKTISDIYFESDSNGVVAIGDPWLLGQKVLFKVSSHGYQYEKKVFDEPGVVLEVKPGGRGDLKIRRMNIAERLYRVTGAGIYHHSVAAGIPVPIKQPLLNGKVTGQDTVVAVPYAGKLFWIWGDTMGSANMNFNVAAATSELPGRGGLDPDLGVDLKYFTGDDGFTKPMLPLPRKGLVWIEGLLTVKDPKGKERLLATYTRQQGLTPPDERGIAVFNDAEQRFDVLKWWPGGRGHYSSHPFRHLGYWYLFPTLRVRDDWMAVQDPSQYEAYTVTSGWKAGAEWLSEDHDRKRFSLTDVETGKPTNASRGAVAWNEHRKRWVMVTAFFGTTYYAEADAPEGPWDKALKIIDHQHYNFYNVTQHPFFAKDNGRVIYIEGTYTDAFTKAKRKTPLYDYNQVMYRLNVDDPRIIQWFGPRRR